MVTKKDNSLGKGYKLGSDSIENSNLSLHPPRPQLFFITIEHIWLGVREHLNNFESSINIPFARKFAQKLCKIFARKIHGTSDIDVYPTGIQEVCVSYHIGCL